MARTKSSSAAKAHSRKSRPAPAYTFLTIPAGRGRRRKVLSATSIKGLIEVFTKFRDESGLGTSDIGARFEVYREGHLAGHLAYGGRWSPAEETAAEPAPEPFDALQSRMLETINHLQCADQVLYDLQNIPEELHPAAIVVHRAATELDKLYNRIDEWHVTHTHRPKTDAGREALAAKCTAGMMAEEAQS
jgi:hypothetical protein